MFCVTAVVGDLSGRTSWTAEDDDLRDVDKEKSGHPWHRGVTVQRVLQLLFIALRERPVESLR